jgi:hypothetical protein
MKMSIALLTNVRPHHQKLVLAGAKGKLQDDALLQSLGLKPGSSNKLMVIGNPEDQLVMDDDEKAAALEPFDDLDVDYRPSELLALRDDPTIRAKVEKYYARVKDTFTLINPIRPNKKLLVLDLDYTLFDMKGSSEVRTNGQDAQLELSSRSANRPEFSADSKSVCFSSLPCSRCAARCSLLLRSFSPGLDGAEAPRFLALPRSVLRALRARDLEPNELAMA